MTDQQEVNTEKAAPIKQAKGYISAHGRRKEASARIRLFKGKGEITINGKPIDQYFTNASDKIKWTKPFTLTKTEGLFYATIKVVGSGKSSQLAAVANGLAKSLSLADSNFRPILRKAGLLTRDSRVKERRKYGRAQKARKGKQSPKR